jgi:hypothetical protein
MSKYTIEGNIDFFAELYKSLDIEENNQKTEEDNNLCLISNEILTDKYVTMECGHKFNYLPLYLDVKNHKQKYNGMEGSSTRLYQDEIRCPYCRKKQAGVLPYYEELGLEKLHGINCIDPNYSSVKTSSHYYKKCQYTTPNPNFDPSGNDIVETNSNNSNNSNNCKFLKCIALGSQINFYHGITEGLNYGDEKYYCWYHKKVVVRKYKKDLMNKAKAEIKEAKVKAKKDAKLAKLKEKGQVKELKRKAKEEKAKEIKIKKISKTLEENIVLGPTTITTDENVKVDQLENNGCVEVLKSGPNKGNKCGCKIVSDNRCKRHIPHSTA